MNCDLCEFHGAPYHRRKDEVFTSSRTGRSFCLECVLAVASWEMDGRPGADDDPDLDGLRWAISEDLAEQERAEVS